MSIVVLGGTGMLGSAIVRKLRNEGKIVIAVSSADDLTDYSVADSIMKTRPTSVYHCAGLVGGLMDNKNRQYDYLMQNAMMATNAIEAAVNNGIENFYYISSSCVYPAKCPQPMKENYIMSGYPESTNRGYAMAKLLGMEACKYAREKTGMNYITMIPCNLYGPQDNFTESGHVLASLVRKICTSLIEEKDRVVIWGDGTARREFLHVDDCADAIMTVIDYPLSGVGIFNIGSGVDYSISEVAKMIAYISGWEGDFDYDKTKPNGMMRKCLDIYYLNELGWTPNISLYDGIDKMIKDFYATIEKR